MRGWLMDLGNTRLKLAALDAADVLGEVLAVPADDADAVQRLLDGIAHLPAPVWLASVATPAATERVQRALDIAGLPWRRVRTQAQAAGVTIAYADPEALGVDRFLAMVAARALRPRRARGSLVVGAGTALTVDLLDAHGRHIGGRIAPGLGVLREALHARVPHLPASGGAAVDFADATDAALASGTEAMLRGALADAVAAARQRLGRKPQLLLHGGDAAVLAADWPQALQRAHLVLEGLARVASQAG